MQCNPLIIDGVLYGTSPQLKVFALDAATGEERWVFNPFPEEENHPAGVNRGLTWWEKSAEQRILFSAGEFLYALDAQTGQPIASFGEQGKTSLKKGLSRKVDDHFVVATSPGVIYQDLIITGTRVSEGTDAAPGDIRAFDVRTGAVQWVFHTIPLPGEPGYDGGADWGGAAFDPETGWLYVNANEMPWLLQLTKLEQSPGLVASAKSLYLTHCAVCHGANRQGDPAANYPSLTDIGDKLSDEAIRKIIQYGRGFMPSFRHLLEEDKDALVAFLTNQTVEESPTGGKQEVTSKDNHTLPYVHTGYRRLVDEEGYPAIKSP